LFEILLCHWLKARDFQVVPFFWYENNIMQSLLFHPFFWYEICNSGRSRIRRNLMFYAWRSRTWGACKEAISLRQDQANLQANLEPPCLLEHHPNLVEFAETPPTPPAQGICIKLSNLG
jgi:hypothetical protein